MLSITLPSGRTIHADHRDGRTYFTGGYYGGHDISDEGLYAPRSAAHWVGYIQANMEADIALRDAPAAFINNMADVDLIDLPAWEVAA